MEKLTGRDNIGVVIIGLVFIAVVAILIPLIVVISSTPEKSDSVQELSNTPPSGYIWTTQLEIPPNARKKDVITRLALMKLSGYEIDNILQFDETAGWDIQAWTMTYAYKKVFFVQYELETHDSNIYEYNLSTHKVTLLLKGNYGGDDLAVNDTGTLLLWSSHYEGKRTIHFLDLTNMKELSDVLEIDGVDPPSFLSNDVLLYTDKGRIFEYNIHSGESKSIIEGEYPSVSHSKEKLAFKRDDRVYVTDINAESEPELLYSLPATSRVFWSPDDTYLLVNVEFYPYNKCVAIRVKDRESFIIQDDGRVCGPWVDLSLFKD